MSFARRASVPAVIPVAVCAYVFWPTLAGYFLADDFGYIHLYSRISLPRFRALFVNDWSQGIWGWNLGELRPFVGLSYWIDFRIWETNAFGYHLTNLLIYGVSILGFYYWLSVTTSTIRSSVPPSAATVGVTVGTILFALHPAHVESVAWIAGRTDLLAAACYLWALVILVQAKTVFVTVSGILIFAVGLFSKESVVTLPVTFLAYSIVAGDFQRQKHRTLAILGSTVGVVVLWAVCRRIAFGMVSGVDVPGFVERLPFYWNEALPVASSPPAILVMLIGALYCLLRALLIKRNARYFIFWGILWPCIHLVPLVAVGYSSSRHIFLAVAGLVVVLALSWVDFTGNNRHVPVIGLIVCCLALYVFWTQTNRDLSDWERSSTLSRELLSLLDDGNYPADSIVVFDSAPSSNVWFWQWALPYSMDKPFIDFRALRRKTRLVLLPWLGTETGELTQRSGASLRGI